MKRKAAALAVGALFLAPAAQAQIVFGNPQVGTLQLYGKLYPQFGYGTSKDATQVGTGVSTLVSTTGVAGTTTATGGFATPVPNNGSKRSVNTQNSYIGFRGERDITTYRLKFIWQIEQSVQFDTGDALWSNRNSFLGVRTGWGTVKLGNMDTIYKEYGDTMQIFGISSGNFISASNILSHIGVGSSGAGRFHERKANSIQYETPTFNGLTFGYQYSPDEARDTTQTSTAGVCATASGNPIGPGQCGRDASLHSYGVKWDSEKLYLSVHQERHNDFYGLSANEPITALRNNTTPGAHSRDTGTRFSAEWRFIQDQRITFDIGRLRYHESGQAAGAHVLSYERTNWAIGWDAGFGGPWRFATQYVRAGEGQCTLTVGDCSATGLDGKMLSAGVRYRFDRQTFVYLIGAKLWNGPSAAFQQSGFTSARGADVLQTALGLSYTF